MQCQSFTYNVTVPGHSSRSFFICVTNEPEELSSISSSFVLCLWSCAVHRPKDMRSSDTWSNVVLVTCFILLFLCSRLSSCWPSLQDDGCSHCQCSESVCCGEVVYLTEWVFFLNEKCNRPCIKSISRLKTIAVQLKAGLIMFFCLMLIVTSSTPWKLRRSFEPQMYSTKRC